MLDDLDRALLGAIGAAANDFIDDIQVPQPGDSVAHYRILEHIGAGGMGVVCKALDTRLDRTVALKFLKPAGAGDVARLEREARAASALNHPDICTIHDFHQAGPYHFIVMEYLQGENLKERLARGPLSEAESIALVLRVAAALAAAHTQNIVHCDVKPANIFVTKNGAIKVLDFGISRRDGATTTGDSGPTHGDSALGTRAYMSPEQARGEKLDQRTDVYSLGALLREATAAPSAALNQLIERMLHPDRAKRPASMSDVMTALSAIGSRRTRQRRWLLAAAAAVVAIGMAVLAATRPWEGPPLLQQRDEILVAAVENRTGDPAFDDVLADTVAVQLGQSPFLRVFSNDAIAEQLTLMRRPAGEALTAALAREICERAGLKAFVSGTITSVGTEYLIRLDAIDARTGDFITREQQQVGDVKGVLRAMGEASATIRRNLGESLQSVQKFDVPAALATTSSLPALRAFREGQQLMAADQSAKAVPFFLRAVELDPDFALAYARLSAVYVNLQDRGKGEWAAREAFLRRDRVSERERYEIAAKYYRDVTGEVAKAVEAMEVGARLYPDDARAHNLLQIELSDIGRIRDAVVHGELAVRLNPQSSIYRRNLIGSYIRLGDFDAARAVRDNTERDGLDTAVAHRQFRLLAATSDDASAMAREDEWQKRFRTDSNQLSDFTASQLGVAGRLAAAQDQYRDLIRRTEARGRQVLATEYLTRLTKLQALLAPQSATVSATQVLGRDPNRYDAAEAALALAVTNGDLAAINGLVNLHAKDELLRGLWLPLSQAVVELRSGRPAQAVPVLRALETYDLGDFAALRPSYYLGQAHLALGAAADARSAFEKIIRNRGVTATNPLFALGRLGVARAIALSGSTAEARAAYERFFAVWPEADADLPVMKAARAEYARLK